MYLLFSFLRYPEKEVAILIGWDTLCRFFGWLRMDVKTNPAPRLMAYLKPETKDTRVLHF